MALEVPLRSSTGNLQFPFRNRGDMSESSDTERPRSPSRVVSSPPPATDAITLRPGSIHRASSIPMNVMSPIDAVGPSPVTSNGTETTEIEDDASDEIEQVYNGDLSRPSESELLMLNTNLPDAMRQSNTEEAVSVIHAPESFAAWSSASGPSLAEQVQPHELATPKPNDEAPVATSEPLQMTPVHPTRPPISTDVTPVGYSLDSITPQAQNLKDMLSDGSRLRSSSTSSLEKIDEQAEVEGNVDNDDNEYSGDPLMRTADSEVAGLRTVLRECWSLCNTLASLSANHRTRAFHSSGTPDTHERAWKTCWKLCQRLYDNQDEDPASPSARMDLDLCRDFCQALFDIRQKKDETTDSVLRVSFELNNHLYSAQDGRNLPEPFRERTLDFYITLCHRLMKQRSELAEESDHLLSACWGLAEMLFGLRQYKRDGQPLDAELLSSANEACWDLCNVLKDGWRQIRPDPRNTPRVSQTSFSPQQTADQSGRESRQSNRSSLHSKREAAKSSHQEERSRKPPTVPETPVTEFEDTPISPESRSPQMPNIMVLGTPSDHSRGGKWSSNASNMSSYSLESNRTSSTATTTTATQDINMLRSKVLVLRAAMNLGFNRDTMTDAKTEPAILQKFVQGLPPGSFGPQYSDATLLQQYKMSALTDSLVPRNQPLPVRSKRVKAQDMAKSIMAMSSSSPRYAFLRDLFKFVFQFTVEEAETSRNVSIAV